MRKSKTSREDFEDPTVLYDIGETDPDFGLEEQSDATEQPAADEPDIILNDPEDENADDADKQDAAESRIKPKNKRPVIVGTVIAVVLVAFTALLVFFVFHERESASDALESYLKDLLKLEYRSALEMHGYDYHFRKSKDRIESELQEIEAQMEDDPRQAKLARAMMIGVTVEVTGDKTLGKSETEALKKKWKTYYTDTDRITEIHLMEYEVVSGDHSKTYECYAIRIGGRWYFKNYGKSSSFTDQVNAE